MLRVDEGGDAPGLLGLGHGVQGQGGLTGRFRPVDFDDAALGQSAHAQGEIQTQAAGGNHFHLHLLGFAQLHHGAFAEILLNAGNGVVQRCFALVAGFLGYFFLFLRALFVCHFSKPPVSVKVCLVMFLLYHAPPEMEIEHQFIFFRAGNEPECACK